MQRGRETAVLTPRRGFIRLAMRTGADVVPCFAFGQSDSYAWARLGPPLVNHGTVTAISRRLGATCTLAVGV
jgi:1-acyl-sn-glycerol-3-phosphate acyltransferase